MYLVSETIVNNVERVNSRKVNKKRRECIK